MISNQFFSHLLGKTLEEANAELAANPVKQGLFPVTRVRATNVDGNQMMVTMDMRTDRLNVVIKDNLITGFTKVG